MLRTRLNNKNRSDKVFAENRAASTNDGQGFSIPGTVSSEFGKKELHSWRRGFYDRLVAHAERAAATVAAATAAAGAAATEETPEADNRAGGQVEEVARVAAVTAEIEKGYPKIVVFAGKRQVWPLFGGYAQHRSVLGLLLKPLRPCSIQNCYHRMGERVRQREKRQGTVFNRTLDDITLSSPLSTKKTVGGAIRRC